VLAMHTCARDPCSLLCCCVLSHTVCARAGRVSEQHASCECVRMCGPLAVFIVCPARMIVCIRAQREVVFCCAYMLRSFLMRAGVDTCASACVRVRVGERVGVCCHGVSVNGVGVRACVACMHACIKLCA
jgi:hypothetical protein